MRPATGPCAAAWSPACFESLLGQFIRREVYSLGSKNAPITSAADDLSPDRSGSGKVIVIGGAVMDARFRTKVLPVVGTSAEALSFSLTPGGKGLNQAVAAARLGLEVALVAAIARDRFGEEIVNYLRDEGVDTSLLKWVDDTRTPFTGTFVEFRARRQVLPSTGRTSWRCGWNARDLDAVSLPVLIL